MKKFAVGYLFDERLEHVLLCEKNRPAWQVGLLNGLGGNLEEGETPHDAMVREFKEEAGVLVENWDHVVSLSGPGVDLDFFCAIGDEDQFWQSNEATDRGEPIIRADLKRLPELPTVQNLQWAVPMCLDTWLPRPIVIKGAFSP